MRSRDRSRDVPQRSEEDRQRREEGRRVDEVDRDEGLRAGHVDEEATQDAADADAEVEQGEVDAEVPLPQVARDDRADQGLDGRPDDPAGEPQQHAARRRAQLGRGRRQRHLRGDLDDEATDDDDPRTDAIEKRADRPDDEQSDKSRQGQQQTDPGQLEPPYLVQVDDVERHDQAVPDEVDDDRRQEELALARQVVPERAQREPADRSRRRRHQASLASGTDSLNRISGARTTSDTLRGGGFA